ncbi:MAG: hypothetical protein ACKPKO_25240, partial [Candidatus Fonsibacter sp.]
MNIAAECAKVPKAKGRGVIFRSFIDTALTIHGRVLGIPTADRLLLHMDKLPRNDNPFNYVQRLQDIVSKRGHNKEHITWIIEDINYIFCVPLGHACDRSGSSE